MCGRSVWKQPAYNGKNSPTHLFIIEVIINSLSERAVSDSPSVHVTEGKKSRPFVTLPYKHRHSPEWEAVGRLCHYWLLAVAAGDIQCQHQRGFSSVVFWDALTNIGVSIDSFIWAAEDTVVKFHCLRKCPGKKSVKSPILVGINTNASCANISSRQSKYHAFVFQIAFLKELLSTL